jgi:hypothetical protein
MQSQTYLPDWILGTRAVLLHNGKLVSKKQDDYVTTAATAPRLCKQLIAKSNRHDPFLAAPWEATTFKDIDWRGGQLPKANSSNSPNMPTTGLDIASMSNPRQQH